jgi:hypothetical protein
MLKCGGTLRISWWSTSSQRLRVKWVHLRERFSTGKSTSTLVVVRGWGNGKQLLSAFGDDKNVLPVMSACLECARSWLNLQNCKKLINKWNYEWQSNSTNYRLHTSNGALCDSLLKQTAPLIKKIFFRAGGVPQAVEHLPGKCEALKFKLQYHQKKKKFNIFFLRWGSPSIALASPKLVRLGGLPTLAPRIWDYRWAPLPWIKRYFLYGKFTFPIHSLYIWVDNSWKGKGNGKIASNLG